jgi:ABC-2 type transport system ATP-binding protein
VLAVSHLTRAFGARVAVDDISFELAAGEIFALLGPNGAGKTTTLRMLAGLIAPTSGAVHIAGEQVTAASAGRLRAAIGFLTESPGLWDRLTVRQNLITYARLYRLADPARAVERVLTLFGLVDRRDDRTAQLSKGLRQRVALARTLLHDPRIVLLDEPTSALDPESARTVRELILRLRTEGRAVLLSTHNLDEVERIADRVAVLRSRLVALDTPAALRARLFGERVSVTVSRDAERLAHVLRSVTGEDVVVRDVTLSVAIRPASAVPTIVRALVEAGGDIESVVPESPPLEDVYLRLLQEQAGDA